MRSEANSLDLNNLPEDYSCRGDGKQASGDSSSSAGRKKKSGAKEEKDEAGKVYECRFCSLKFCKSQALGGHMNRHRQERETETLIKARQLVFSNDLGPPAHLGYASSGQPVSQGGYHQGQATTNMDDPAMIRTMYPSRIYTTSPLAPPPPQTVPYAFPSPPRLLSQYQAAPPPNEYFVGHVMPNSCYAFPPNGNYCHCIGAPVGGGATDAGDSPGLNQEEGANWGRR